ncbi:tetratricopeptide repeat protein [Melittangium boletus]|uniref:tetratricopeptide repeat protein n=1 Tax=Melittangium boletus TaxID=83453 RepID=UPI003DA4C704
MSGVVLGGLVPLLLAGCGAARGRVAAPPGPVPAVETPLARDASPCDAGERACGAGDGRACTRLGREAPPDAARALFARACAAGDGEGCARHALALLLGEGGAADEAEGRRALQAACERTPREACGLAAVGLAEAARRAGTPGAPDEAALLAQEGCHAGDGFACRLLGDVFLEGGERVADTGQAFALYARACEAGDGQGCAAQGTLVRQWTPGEAARADALLTRGCELGASAACGSLVVQALHGEGTTLDTPGQRALFSRACDAGAAMGCLALYETLRHAPETRGSLQLPTLLKRACQLGEARACGFLEDVSRVAGPACAEGTASSCGVMGALLVSAPRREGEAREGLRLLEGACAAGDGASCGVLREARPREAGGSCRSR